MRPELAGAVPGLHQVAEDAFGVGEAAQVTLAGQHEQLGVRQPINDVLAVATHGTPVVEIGPIGILINGAGIAYIAGGIISVIGVYIGMVDKFPLGTIMNRSLTIRSGQCHVHRYMRPLLKRIQDGEIDPRMVITHRLPLSEAARGYEMFLKKEDNCEKVILKAA